jgi:hypothetical protein
VSRILKLGSDNLPNFDVNVILHRRSVLSGDILSPSNEPTGSDELSNWDSFIEPHIEELELDSLSVNDESGIPTVRPVRIRYPYQSAGEGSEDGLTDLCDEINTLVSPGAATSSESTRSGRIFPELDSLQDRSPFLAAHFSIR